MTVRTWPTLTSSCGGSGGIDENVGIGLDENPGLALVGIAHLFARRYRFGHSRMQVLGCADAHARFANSAEVRQAIRQGLDAAIDRARHHQCEPVFADALGAAEQDGVGQAAAAEHLPELRYDGLVAMEISETHFRRVALGQPSTMCGARASCAFRISGAA